jgi:hypothetical protein
LLPNTHFIHSFLLSFIIFISNAALIKAGQTGNTKCIKLLLKAGANKEAKDIEGYTALIVASQEGHVECIELLVTAGADKEAFTDQGDTALILASGNGRVKSVELLLKFGCNVNALDYEGVSALIIAVCNDRIDCARTLVRAGANANIQFRGHSLDFIADDTSTNSNALKAALRLPAEKRRCCAQCGTTTSEKLQKCSACKTVYYCNRECQVAHWKRHKPVCSVAAE